MFDFVSKFFLIMMLALPVVLSIRLIMRRRSKMRQWFLSMTLAAVGCYALMIAAVVAIGMHFERTLYQYDLDGDGVFSGDELTLEMEQAMDDLTHDTGRSYAPFTSLIVCPIYSGFWHLVIGFPYLLISAKKRIL